MNFANAIPPKMKRHNAANMTKLFVGIGKLSGNFMTPIAASTIAAIQAAENAFTEASPHVSDKATTRLQQSPV
jgi:hypothetical protein